MASGRNRSQFNQTFIPQYTYTGVGKNRKAVPMNAAAISEMISNNPQLNPGGGILSSSESQNTGIISNANAGSTNVNPVVTNTTTDNEDKEPQNIFGERIAQALFPGISQDNKQLINAAILRGSLELLKPRQPGENLASQLGRGLQAGTQLGADIQKRQLEALTTQAALLKAQQGKMPSQVTITENKLDSFKDLAGVLRKTSPTFEKNLGAIQSKIGDMFGPNADTLKALATEAIGRQSANPRLSPEQALEEAAVSILGGNISSISVSQTEPTEDKFAGAGR